MKICAKVSDEGHPFLDVGPKVIWLIYFIENYNIWNVQKLFFHIEEVRLKFSKRKA